MPDIRYLTPYHVVALREEYLRRAGFKEAPPLRDMGLLESAVHRPQMAAFYEGADLIRQAALLGAGIIQNHPWHDGNKRGAYAAVVTFLDLNGVTVSLPGGNPLALAEQFEAIATRRSEGMDLHQATDVLEAWLREHTAPRES
jgi:death-on-curing protein